MNLIEVLSNYQGEIQENGVLMEYDLFFDNIRENCCRFSIDDNEELEKLKHVISKMKERDEKAEIYVCTYGIDLTEEKIFIYGDMLWIDTIIDLKELNTFFENCRKIEPSSIMLLSEDETLDGIVSLVFLSDGTVQNYESFIQKRELDQIKSLYWD